MTVLQSWLFPGAAYGRCWCSSKFMSDLHYYDDESFVVSHSASVFTALGKGRF